MLSRECSISAGWWSVERPFKKCSLESQIKSLNSLASYCLFFKIHFEHQSIQFTCKVYGGIMQGKTSDPAVKVLWKTASTNQKLISVPVVRQLLYLNHDLYLCRTFNTKLKKWICICAKSLWMARQVYPSVTACGVYSSDPLHKGRIVISMLWQHKLHCKVYFSAYKCLKTTFSHLSQKRK